MCRRRARGPSRPASARPRARRSAAAPAAAPCGRSRRTTGLGCSRSVRPLLVGVRLDRDPCRYLLGRGDLVLNRVEIDLVVERGDDGGLRAVRRGRVGGRFRLHLANLLFGQRGPDGLCFRRQLVRAGLEGRLGLGDDRLDVRRLGLALGKLLVGGDAAVAGTGQRRVRAPLAVREDRRAAAGELLVFPAAAEGSLGLGLGELTVGLDVDLPAGQTSGQAGVHALLADCKRELVVRRDDRRLLAVVVEIDLAHARRRQCLRDEARRLRVPRDDVDLLAAELGDDHADARAARADTGANRVDALGVRLDGDLRAVTGLTGDAADLHQPVGDLGHLQLEERLDQLGIAARDDHLRPLRARADLSDDGLDPRALLVALAVHLLGPREQGLDLAEVNEHVVAVARLLDDGGDDLGDSVDVLLVHHLALRLADPLSDHLLRGLRGDTAKVLRGDVLALHLVFRDVGPVDLEVLVLDEHVRTLACLLLRLLELGQDALASLL